MSNFNATKYKNEFAKQNYERLNIVVPKGQKQSIQEFAKSQNKSLNAFVVDLINSAISTSVNENNAPVQQKTENLNLLLPENNLNNKIVNDYMLLSDDCKKIVDALIDGLLNIQRKNNSTLLEMQNKIEKFPPIESTNIPPDRIIAANNMNVK